MSDNITDVPTGPVQDMNQSGVQDAAEAFGNLLDLGEEKNPAAEVGQDGRVPDERPNADEQPEDIMQASEDALRDDVVEQVEEVVEEEIDEPEEAVYAIKVNGEDQEVTLDELQRGYMFNADYTQKTQALANERREFEQHQAQVFNERQQYSQLLGALEQQLVALAGQEPDWEKLSREDPVGYVQQKEAWNQRIQQVQAARNEQARIAELNQRDQHRSLQNYLRGQQEALIAAKPELSDAQAANEFRSKLFSYAQSQYGITEQELASMGDHRAVLILEKAMMYDALQNNGNEVRRKVVKRKQPVVKPGSTQGKVQVRSRTARKARERLESTGSVEDAAAAMEDILS